MQLAISIRPVPSTAEVDEAVNLLRPPDLWLRLIIGNWYACAIAVLVIAVDVYRVARGRAIPVAPTAALFIFVAAAFLFSWIRWVGKTSRGLLRMGANLRELTIDHDGVRMLGHSGILTIIPWSSYQSWQEGESIFLLKGRDGATILPAADLNRAVVRTFLENMLR